jgi:hypothetical protein
MVDRVGCHPRFAITIAPVSGRGVLASAVDLARAHAPVLAVMAAWTAFPVVALVIYVSSHGGVLTGANGYDPFDQMQYLAWIRDAGTHVLASNLWRIAPTPHDYLQPMYLVSAGLWRLGIPLQAAYMIFKPVGLLLLFGGCAWYAQRMLPGRRWLQMAAVMVAVFYLSPVLQIATWTHHLSAVHRFELVLATEDASVTGAVGPRARRADGRADADLPDLRRAGAQAGGARRSRRGGRGGDRRGARLVAASMARRDAADRVSRSVRAGAAPAAISVARRSRDRDAGAAAVRPGPVALRPVVALFSTADDPRLRLGPVAVVGAAGQFRSVGRVRPAGGCVDRSS